MEHSEATELKERVQRERGFFGDFHEALLRISPRWLELYLEYGAAPVKLGAISERLKHLIWIAADCVPAHLYERGVRRHIALAREAGVSFEDIFEVLELACDLGQLSCEVSVPILMEELQERGLVPEDTTTSARFAAMRAEMIASRGEWPGWMDQMAALGPDFVEAYGNMLLEPWRRGSLAPKEKEFIYLGIYSSPVTYYAPGVRRHIRRALDLGATPAELLEVIQLTSMLTFHSCTVGAPLVAARMEAEATGA